MKHNQLRKIKIPIVYPVAVVTVQYLAPGRMALKPKMVLVKVESPEGREVVEPNRMLVCLEQARADIARTIEDCKRWIEQEEICRIAEEADSPHAPDHLPLPSEIEDLLKGCSRGPAQSPGRRR